MSLPLQVIMKTLLLLSCMAVPCLTQHQQEPNLRQYPLDEEPLLHTPATTNDWNLTCGNISEAVLYSEVVRDQIDDFKDAYTIHEYQLPWDVVNQLYLNETEDYRSVRICDEHQEQCSYVLPRLPLPPYVHPHTQQEARTLLVRVLGYAQRYAVAFETMFLDQSLTEDVFLVEISALVSSLSNLVESLQITVAQCDLTPDQHLMFYLSSMLYTDTNEQVRRERGFKTLRQTHNGMVYIEDVFGHDKFRVKHSKF